MKFLKNLLLATAFIFFANIAFMQTIIYDEFNGTQLNTDYWGTWPEWGITYTAPPSDPYNSNETYYFQNDNGQNVIVENGILKLVLRNQPGYYDTWYFGNCSQCTPSVCSPSDATSITCSGTPGNCFCIVPKHYVYTSGQIVSKSKFLYGTFEAKIKIPKNTWPAFWLYGECDEEIDIFEFLADDQIFDQTCDERDFTVTIHENVSDSPCNCSKEVSEGKKGCHKQCSENVPSLPTTIDLNLYPDYSEDFHIWTLIWTPDEITIKVDGVQKFHCNRTGIDACIKYTDALDSTDNNCSPFHNKTLYPDHPMWVILNLGRQKPSECIPDYPATMEIDYVKIWTLPLPDCTPGYSNDVTISNGSIFGSSELHIKNSITTSGTVKIESGANVYWTAPSIKLQPGFKAKEGAVASFEASECSELFGRLANSDTTKAVWNPADSIVYSSAKQSLEKSHKTDAEQQEELNKLKETLDYPSRKRWDTLSPIANIQEVIKITPNPSADGKFNLYCSFQDVGCMDAEITVLNALGQAIHKEPLNHYIFPVSIDLSSHPKGTYFINIQNAGKVIVQKIISQ